MPETKYKTLIVWMRRDLRVHDNAALHEACRQAEQVIPLFVLDPAILDREDTGAARVAFLLDALRVLDGNLQERGGRLILRKGKVPEEIIRAVEEFGADGVFHHREYEPAGLKRDDAVAQALRERGKVIETFPGLALFEPDEILSKTGTPYTVYSPYSREWFSRPAARPLAAPRRVPMPVGAQAEALPTAADLKFSTRQTFACGGEDAAQELLGEFVSKKIGEYDTQRDILSANGTSLLSRHLHFGTMSPRVVVDAVRQAGKDQPSGSPSGEHQPEPGHSSFLGEIAWHDFYLQILHHFPHVAEGAFRPQFDALEWENDEAMFSAWKEGRTGYPIVDAAMRQLNAEAWMHNRGRMIVASFLTKDLLIDWRWGEQYFMQQLVDGDQAANNGGWQWAAGTGTDAQPFFRIFNPTTQGEKFDPDGTYVKRWVPELARVPAKLVHTPWKLSEAERAHLGCASYPRPVVDHAKQRTLALAMYGKVTKKGMRRWIVSAAAWTMAFGLVAAGRAQTPQSSIPAGPPDVVVIVYQQPGRDALVDMTYAYTVPHAQAQRDEAALAQAAGATISAGKVTDGEAPVQRKMGPMTGIVFSVPNLIPDDAQTLPVEPFIVALRKYKRLVLIFSVSPNTSFQPLGNYADKNVQIAMTQHGLVYTYQVDVLNPRFDHLNLPQSPAMTRASPMNVSRHPRPWTLFLGLVAAAMAAGILVYALMARKTPLPPAQNETTDALPEERTHIGTKG